MDRRRFLQNAAVTTAALHYFPGFAAGAEREDVALDRRIKGICRGC